MAIPEFILRKLFVQGSLQIPAKGFAFALNNIFASVTLTSMRLKVDRQPVSPEPPAHIPSSPLY